MRRQPLHLTEFLILGRIMFHPCLEISVACDAFVIQQPSSTDIRSRQRSFTHQSPLQSEVPGATMHPLLSSTAYRNLHLLSAEATHQEDRNSQQVMQGDDEISFGTESDAVWKAYTDAMEEMITRPRVVKKAKAHEIDKCREYLLCKTQRISPLTSNLPSQLDDDSPATAPDFLESKESLHMALQEQSAKFQEHYNFTRQEHDFISRCLVYIGDACAKVRVDRGNDDDTKVSTTKLLRRQAPIVVAWSKFKEMGWLPRENAFSTYMYILGSRDEDVATENDESNNPIQALCDTSLIEVVTCHGWLYGRNEKTIAIQLKNLIGRRKVIEAEQLLASLEKETAEKAVLNATEVTDTENLSGSQPQELGLKLRTFLPLFRYYCEIGDANSTLQLYHRMQAAPGVYFDVEAYTLLLSSLARHRHFEQESDYGPELFEELVTTMAADVLELTPETVQELEAGFTEGFTSATSTSSVRFDRVQISSNRTCPKTGTELRLISLDKGQRQHVHDTLLVMARLARQEFTARVENRQSKKKEKRAAASTERVEDAPDKDPAYQALLNFSHWMNDRTGKPYTAIVDGANVAYYGHSNVHYCSLKRVVEKLLEMGETPLVVMPSKYVQASFHTSGPYSVQFLSKRDFEVIEWLQESDMMYIVPRLSLDDYFWMLASVSNQDKSREGADLSVAVNDSSSRFPGMRPMIISNDQMRDHRLELLRPREFRRWCSCHIVNYHIGPYEEDEWTEQREIEFEPADYFSREIQGNPHPSGNGNVWHFPISNASDWFFICIER